MSFSKRRSVTFLLSPRVVDLDSYLPVAMELKAARPDWNIRFVAFDQSNVDTIQRNPSLLGGLRKCATLVKGGSSSRHRTLRFLAQIFAFIKIAGPILRWRGPVLINSRPFSVFPYDILAFLARLRGGTVVAMCKNRSPDAVHELMFSFRDLPPKLSGSKFARLTADRDADLLVHYHDTQQGLMQELERFGRTDEVPKKVIGMPHRLPAWRGWIESEVERERKALEESGALGPNARVFGIFAAKPGSGGNLGNPGAIERSFNKLLPVLRELDPNATILVRAHPKAVGAEYIEKWLQVEGGNIRLTFMHPEVLIALSDRVFANNPTNVLFHGFGGCQIDVSEYPEVHFQRHGPVSLAHGLGPLYADPRDDGFKDRIAQLLADDSAFASGEHDDQIRAILDRNPSDITPLLAHIEPTDEPLESQESTSIPSKREEPLSNE